MIKAIKHNIGYKLLALTAAAILWGHARNPNVVTELTLPLEVRKVEAGFVVTAKPKDVKVVLEGPKERVNSIAAEPDSVTPYASLHGKKEGQHRLQVFVELPLRHTELVLARADPPDILVSIERKAQRALKIGAEFSGTPPVGFRFGPPHISPSRAVVAGIASQVDEVVRLVVVIDPGTSGPNSIDGDFTVKALDRNDREIQGLDINPQKVRVHLEMERAPVSRVVFISPSISGHPPFPYKVSDIDVQPETVILSGPAERLVNISTVVTEPLKLDQRTETFSQRVRVLAPSGTSLEDGTPVRITVKITSLEPDSRESSSSEGADSP